MSAYVFSALDSQGKTQKGVLEADSSRQARDLLRQRGLVPLSVEGSVDQQESDKLDVFRWRRRISAAELALITRQLATLIQSGMPVDKALQAVASQSENQQSRTVLVSVRAKVVEGYSLSEAMLKQKNSFSATYREMVRAGEHSGYLGPVLEQLAEHLERSTDSQHKVKMALLYPCMLMGVALLMVVGLITYVVPQVVGVFAEQGAQLPVLTRYLIYSSDLLRENGWLIVSVLAGMVISLRVALKTPRVRLSLDRFRVSTRLLRRLFRASSSAQFSNTLSILVRGGIPIVDGVRIAREAMSNQWVRARLADSIKSLEEGSSLHKSLDQCGVFSPLMLHMTASGEASGDLSMLLEKAAEHEQRRLNYLIDGSLKLLEPAILLGVGTVIFIIVLAILQPIFELNQLL